MLAEMNSVIKHDGRQLAVSLPFSASFLDGGRFGDPEPDVISDNTFLLRYFLSDNITEQRKAGINTKCSLFQFELPTLGTWICC